MKEEPAEVTRDGITLRGTWTLPEQPKGVVICVHGSGPMDRDQNGKGGKLETFRVMAEALYQAGFACLRYDKRGVGASGGEYEALGQADLVADVQAWIPQATVRGLGPVWLLGHSEGTALAPAAAEGHAVAGLILLCPYITPGREILMQQAAKGEQLVAELRGFKGVVARAAMAIFGRPTQMQARVIAKLETTDAPKVRAGLKKVPTRWLRDFITADVAAIHRANQRPTLVVVAARDAQCPPEDGAKIAALNPKAELVVLEDLSHLLRHTTVDGFDDYLRQLKSENDPRPAEVVVEWLTRQVSA